MNRIPCGIQVLSETMQQLPLHPSLARSIIHPAVLMPSSIEKQPEQALGSLASLWLARLRCVRWKYQSSPHCHYH
jgi:hypothetical protein